jgi:hypothetical protein
MYVKYVRLSLLVILSIYLWGLNLIPIYSVDPELKYYHDMFNKALKINCGYDIEKPRQVIVKFAKIKEPDVMGLCERGLFRSTIKIDPDKWQHLTLEERFVLMMHEETHCQLKVEHSNNPRHYMYPDIIQTNPWIVTKQVIQQMKEVCK